MFGWFKKKEEIKQVELPQPVVEIPAVLVNQDEHSKPKKPRKPKVKKEKPAPQPKVEPRVDVLKFDFDPADPRLGSIELDWNTEFVELLTKHGYLGASEEEIVDKWLNDVCQNIVANEYEGANVPPSKLSAANLVSRKPLGNGKSEIS